jgi:hypothetical protein
MFFISRKRGGENGTAKIWMKEFLRRCLIWCFFKPLFFIFFTLRRKPDPLSPNPYPLYYEN